VMLNNYFSLSGFILSGSSAGKEYLELI